MTASRRILVLDDSASARVFIRMELETLEAVEVREAASAPEALELALEWVPDLITSDLEIEGMDGLAFVRKLREQPETAHIPVILITSAESDSIREQAFEAGVVELFLKPFPEGDLANYAGELLEQERFLEGIQCLVADDAPSVRNLLQRLLEHNGARVLTAEDGRQALQQLRHHPVDLIFTDLLMPHLDGLELCKRIREEEAYQETSILVLTSLHEQETRIEALRNGASDFLTKPFSREELKARLKNEVRLIHLRRQQLQQRKQEQLSSLMSALRTLSSSLSEVLGQSLQVLETVVANAPCVPEEEAEGTQQALENIRDLLESLEAFSRRTPRVERQKVGLQTITKHALDLLRARFKEDAVTIEQVHEEPEPEVICDAAALELAVFQLLLNALEAMEGQETRLLTIRSFETSEQVGLEVEDTGRGIESEHLPRVFDPFFTTKLERSAGMGLAVAYGVVEEHGGQLEITSRLGRGTRLRLELPKGVWLL